MFWSNRQRPQKRSKFYSREILNEEVGNTFSLGFHNSKLLIFIFSLFFILFPPPLLLSILFSARLFIIIKFEKKYFRYFFPYSIENNAFVFPSLPPFFSEMSPTKEALQLIIWVAGGLRKCKSIETPKALKICHNFPRRKRKTD